MNDYGVSPFAMMQLVGPMMVIVPMLLWLLVIGPLLIYPLARWKANREQIVDNQLGIKVALHYFRMVSFQLLLLGATLLIWTVISKGSDKGDQYRAAFGMLMPGGIVFALHSVFVAKTNDVHYPGVRRLFLGYNLLVTGIIGFIALVLAFQALLAKGSTGDAGRVFFASTLVYCGAWAACGLQFGKLVLGDFGSVGGPPGNIIAPPPPPAPGATPPGNPAGLPPLSQGSFPPIEPK